MLTATPTHEVIGFGKFKGVPYTEAPYWCLRWISEKARHPHNRLLASCELTRRSVIREAERAALWPLPSATPRVVCGIALDRHESAAFAEALTLGRLPDRPWLPASSAFWLAWDAFTKESRS